MTTSLANFIASLTAGALVLAVILWWVISISNQWIFIFLVPLAIVFSIAVLFGFPDGEIDVSDDAEGIPKKYFFPAFLSIIIFITSSFAFHEIYSHAAISSPIEYSKIEGTDYYRFVQYEPEDLNKILFVFGLGLIFTLFALLQHSLSRL